MNNIGWAIKTLRTLPGRERIKQQDIAAACGVGESTVSKWETGRVAPSDEHVDTICNLLNVTRRDIKRMARRINI